MNWLDEKALNWLTETVRLHRLEDLEAAFKILGRSEVELPSDEYFLMRGREVIEHCDLPKGRGQAFTSRAKRGSMKLGDLLRLAPSSDLERALLYSSLNALMNMLGEVEGTVHCRGWEAEACGDLLARELRRRLNREARVLHVGYQPGHVRALAEAFEGLMVTDMDPSNVGKVKFGVKVRDASENEDAIRVADVALITGSAAVNGTLHELLELCERYGVDYVIYGVTGRGVAKLLGAKSFCPFAK
ncbi:MAG: hypothetical protein DRJ97_07715 [Thermoprotei archaeon]|nr:MAG: hypothetical protein DRJ97_07715 [Thermoprotei archaeon]